MPTISPLARSFLVESRNFVVESRNFVVESRNFVQESRNFEQESRNFEQEKRNFDHKILFFYFLARKLDLEKLKVSYKKVFSDEIFEFLGLEVFDFLVRNFFLDEISTNES